MKSAVITAAVFLLSVSSLQAQDSAGHDRGGNHGKFHRGDPITHLTEKLNLSEDQAVEVEAILEEARAQHKEIQKSVREEHCAVRDATLVELSEVLDEAQLAQLEDMQSQRRGRNRHHGMPRFPNCDT